MAYSSAIRREVRWRVTGTDAWSDIATCSPVAELRLEGLDRAKTYDVEVRDISACGAPSAWVLHTAVVPDVAAGNITLSDLSTAASDAQADATSALNQLTDIASDGKLTAQEKVLSKQDYLTLTGEQAGIAAQASAYAITTEKTAYDSAVSALKTYLKNNVFVLDAGYNWTNVTGTTALVRADWDSNWTAVYTTRQALLNKIYALAKAKADAAQGTANTANANTPNVINPQFADGAAGWTYEGGWAYDAATQSAKRTGTGAASDSAVYNNRRIAVKLGQQVAVQCMLTASGADGVAGAMVRFFTVTGAHVSDSTPGNTITGTVSTPTLSRAIGVAPAGAVYAVAAAAVFDHSAGSYTTDDFVLSLLPADLGEVPDGGGRYGVHQVDGNGLAVIDFSQPGHVNKTQSYIGDDLNYRRVAASFTDTSNRPIGLYYNGMRTGDYFLARANATGTQPLATISDAGTLASKNGVNLDADVADGTNYRRVGSGYTDTSGRVTKVWNGTTVKTMSDGVFAADSITRLGGRTLENIADGGGYSRVKSAQVAQGVVSILGTGRNAIANPTFTQNFAGVANGVAITSGTIIDGWTYVAGSAGAGSPLSVCIPFNGSMRVRTYAGFPIPAGTTGNAAYCRSDMFAVLSGKPYALAIGRSAGVSGSLNAGLTFYHRVYLSFRDSAGAGVANHIFDADVFSASPVTVTGTVPTGAVACYCFLTSYCTNPGGATTLAADYYDVVLGSIEYVQAASLDTDVADGSVYGRAAQADLYVSGGVNRVGLRVPGSGHRLGDQRNTPSSLSRAYGAVRSVTALTVYSAGAVDVQAHTLTMGPAAINYNAVSNAVTGLTVGQTYQIYTRDNYAGGSPTWLATQSAATANSFDDAYIGGSITVPSSGSGGGGLPGGGGCVHVDSWLQPGLRAKHVRWWQRLDCAHRGHRYRRWQSWPARVRFEPCVRLVAEGGAALVCSIHTPFDLRDGATMFAADMYGHEVLTDHGWRRVVDVIGVGIQPVMRIHVGGRSYAAGEDPANRFYSHNPVK